MVTNATVDSSVGSAPKKPGVITFGDIKLIKLGTETFDRSKLNYFNLKIVQRINDHVRIYLGLNIDATKKDEYIKMMDSRTEVLIQYGYDNQTLFRGVLTHLEIKMVGARDYHMEIKGASLSHDLDITLKDRSFIKRKMTYFDLFYTIRDRYKDIMCRFLLDNNVQLGGFTLQYHETDWKFLRRMASRFSSGIVAHASYDKAAVTFGIYDENKQVNYMEINQYNVVNTVGKNTHDDYYTDENDAVMRYKLTTRQLLEIGDPVSFDPPPEQTNQNSGSKQKDPRWLYVIRSIGTMVEGGDMIWEHILTPEAGLTIKPYSRRRITGMSLEGVVKDRIQDTALVELLIDRRYGGAAQDQYKIDAKAEAKNKAELAYFPCGTPYTAELNTGFYCMPEIGDFVKVYFPTENEADGFIMQSIRRQIEPSDKEQQLPNLKVSQPAVKYFRTKYGKEIKFDQNELVITVQKYDLKNKKVVNTDVVVLKLNDEEGVSITTQKKVTITAENDLTIISKNGNVTIASGDKAQLTIKSGASFIDMKDGNTSIKGKKVKTN